MLRSLICFLSIYSFALVTYAEDQSADQVIRKAIKLLEADRETVKDTFEQAKIDKAIRDLEAMIEGSDPSGKPAPLSFEVTAATLKKKFGGKAVFNAKTGELSLTYDFAGKVQLNDFDIGSKKVSIAKRTLLVEAGDDLMHVAHFKSFAVSTVMTFNELNGVGIASTSGVVLGTGGRNRDTISLKVPLSKTANEIIPDFARKGSVPVVFTVTPQKSTVKWANELLAVQAPVLAVPREETHQVVLKAGAGGCAFGNLNITGVPDPEWFKEFLGE